MDDPANVRRLVYIPFHSRFCDEPMRNLEFPKDMNLYSKFPSWRQIHLLLLLESIEQDLVFPQIVQEFTKTAMKDADPLSNLLDEVFEAAEDLNTGIPLKQIKALILERAEGRKFTFKKDEELVRQIQNRLSFVQWKEHQHQQVYSSGVDGSKTRARKLFVGIRLKQEDGEGESEPLP